MRTITLIRHSQASFGEENYDKLSDLGLAQSELIGEASGRGIFLLMKRRPWCFGEAEARKRWRVSLKISL